MVDKFSNAPKYEELVPKINEIIDNMGGTITVDQTYDSTSQNAQSGVAIAGAKFIQNTANISFALGIGGINSPATASGMSSIAIGGGALANTSDTMAIGRDAEARSQGAIQLGYGANYSKSLSVGFYDSSTPANYKLLDGTTGYIPNDRLIGLLETIYPVGALYISTTSTCPLASLFGTWTLVTQDKALWTGDGTNADTTIAAGLPQIYGEMTSLMCGGVPTYAGAISPQVSGKGAAASNVDARRGIRFYASSSNSIYGSSTTVQPPAYVVNVWKRTA